MAVPTTKAELLSAISTTFEKLMSDLARIPTVHSQEASLEGHVTGTQMSPSDLVAYLIGWNELVLKWLDQDDRGKTVEFPETGFKWNQLGQLAQKFYTNYPELTWLDRLERLTTVKGQLVEKISTRSDDELYGRAWHGAWTKGRMIQFNTSSPYANARGRIRKWLKGKS
jgi:hypothetical protein